MTMENTNHLSSEMTCQELVELVTEYLEGTLAPADRLRFDAHLGTCPGCTAYVEQMRTTIRVLGKLSEESLSEDARRDLLATFRTWKAEVAKGDE
jgi:anti-sigma factor RsiW